MEESWDAENFEPKLTTALASSNWEGEDEDDEVKESWEDEEEEKKDEEKKEAAAPAKSKKKLVDKIAEKERAAKEAAAARRVADDAETANMTPEQRCAEKMRRQKLQEESDLRLAMETFGVSDNTAGKIDTYNPNNKEEFVEFAELIAKKVNLYRAREEFPGFVEDLVRTITVQMSSLDIKRIKTTVDNLYIEKQKAEKNEKVKKTTKGKGKAKLRVEGENAHLNEYEAYGSYDTQDYDEFI